MTTELEIIEAHIVAYTDVIDDVTRKIRRLMERRDLLRLQEKMPSSCIRLVSFDPKRKIDVIKVIRVLTALGLSESKKFVEAAPIILTQGTLAPRGATGSPMWTLAEAAAELRRAGAVVDVCE